MSTSLLTYLMMSYWKYLISLCAYRGVADTGARVSVLATHCFGSPLRLNLRLFYSKKTPARHTLYVWPALPLIIVCDERAESVDGIVAVTLASTRGHIGSEHQNHHCDP